MCKIASGEGFGESEDKGEFEVQWTGMKAVSELVVLTVRVFGPFGVLECSVDRVRCVEFQHNKWVCLLSDFGPFVMIVRAFLWETVEVEVDMVCISLHPRILVSVAPLLPLASGHINSTLSSSERHDFSRASSVLGMGHASQRDRIVHVNRSGSHRYHRPLVSL